MAQTFEEISYVGSLPMTLSQCNVSGDIFPQSILGEEWDRQYYIERRGETVVTGPRSTVSLQSSSYFHLDHVTCCRVPHYAADSAACCMMVGDGNCSKAKC